MMNEPRRQLFILNPGPAVPDSKEIHAGFDRLYSRTKSFDPVAISPDVLKTNGQLDGNVLLIPSASWPQGVLSDLTRFADLSIVALIGPGDGQDRVGLWYVLGAVLVLDDSASPAVLNGALEKLLEAEVQTLQPRLTRKESMVFQTLRRAGEAGLDRAQIAERIWEDVSVQKKTIDVHVFNLRRKLNSTRFRIVCEARRFVLVELTDL